ncbi:uncharacterized protein LOC129250275 [Anastrepha obliqua]|uniref:uncharacterized protein LOC129250275 n=1 Tax=Anastrepha obliqua TaxID=95512 RepID=UPI0024097C87|nr:uncharacterized protein LOC129250275 [Anastrepha obliqua]
MDSSDDEDIQMHENVQTVNEDSDNNSEDVNFTDTAPAQSTNNTHLQTFPCRFLKRFRLIKEAFEFDLQQINLTKSNAKAVLKMLQLAAILSLSASGGYQHRVGSDYLIGMSQSTLSKLCLQLIRFPPEDSLNCKESFMEQDKIPGVVRCVDGTHIGLQKPTANGHMYFIRKGSYSINVMVVSCYYNILLE